MSEQQNIRPSKFFERCAELLAAGQFSASYFNDVVLCVNTLRQIAATEKQREKAQKAECEWGDKCECGENCECKEETLVTELP